MIAGKPLSNENNWKCSCCDCAMVIGPVTLKYMENEFKTDLPKCPHCGRVYISPELAMGKMAEVEQLLEDK
jgi:hypothetical protein